MGRVRVGQDAVEAKPAELTFEEAAAVPLAALTALQGLRDHGQVRAGQNVLINGGRGEASEPSPCRSPKRSERR